MPTAVIIALLSFGASMAAYADTRGLTPHRAEYKVKISVLSGELTTRLAATADGYEATHAIRPTGFARMLKRGSIEEISDFAVVNDGIVPTRYSSNDTLTRDGTQAELSFDWATRTISGSVDGADVQTTIDSFAHDRVSIQYELMHDLMNGGAKSTYVLFDIDRLKTLNVRSLGRREIKVPAGKFDAVGIEHQAEGSSRVTTLWCVEDLDFLPVMIEQHRNGKLRLQASLESYTPEPSIANRID